MLNVGVNEWGESLDPNAVAALAETYAALVRKTNPRLADDLLNHLAHGVPVGLAQHEDAA